MTFIKKWYLIVYKNFIEFSWKREMAYNKFFYFIWQSQSITPKIWDRNVENIMYMKKVMLIYLIISCSNW